MDYAKFIQLLIDAMKENGPVGDFVGGFLNPIISIVALTYLIRTFKLQRIELEATRKIVEEQAKEAKEQSKAAKKQNAALTIQAILNHTYGQISNAKADLEYNLSLIRFYTDQLHKVNEVNALRRSAGSGGYSLRETRIVSMSGKLIEISSAMDEMREINENIHDIKKQIAELNNYADKEANRFLEFISSE